MRRALLLLVLVAGCATGSAEIELPERDGGSSETQPASDSVAPTTKTDSSTPATDTSAIFETECDAGLARCSGVCVDTNSDEAHCGTCDKACATGERCVMGACEIVCMSPTTKCGTTCVNTNTDEKNCGACGNACGAGESCTSGSCIAPSTTVTFPSSTSSTFGTYAGSGTLGTGGGGRFYVSGDYVQQSFARSAPATKLSVNFRMSDTTSSYCYVGTLTWNVLVNGVVVGSYSWVGGSGGDKNVSQTYSFTSIAPSSGQFTLRFQATRTVCSGGGSWNWYSGGTATLQ